MGDLFDSPWKILIIVAVILILFGSRKMPEAARSLGRSMRIFKREVKALHEDEPDEKESAPAYAAVPGAAPQGTLPQGTVVSQGTAPPGMGAQPQPVTVPETQQQTQRSG